PFFESLYNQKVVFAQDVRVITECLRKNGQTLCHEAAQQLKRDYTLTELLDALKSCNMRSSPGPDGLPFQFYASTWEVTGPILLCVLNSLATVDLADRPTTELHIHLLQKPGGRAD
ncbi:hypothetical protein OIV83_006494, partial [Microbotryomycetes sp. JL201]